MHKHPIIHINYKACTAIICRVIVLYLMVSLGTTQFLKAGYINCTNAQINNSGAAISGGNLIFNDTLNNAGTIALSGNWNNNGTHLPDTGTLIFNADTNQFIKNSKSGETFYKLQITNGGLPANKSVNFNQNNNIVNKALVINNGRLQLNGYNFTNNGTTHITGVNAVLSDSSAVGTNLFKGLISITNNGLWDFAGNPHVYLQGGLYNAATFNSGTGTYYFTANTQKVKAANGFNIGFMGKVQVQGTATTVNAAGNISVSDSLIIATNSTFNSDSAIFNALGNTWVWGTLADNSIEGYNVFHNLVTINPTANWDFRGNDSVQFQNGLTYHGNTFNSGTGTYRFSNVSQNIIASKPITINGKVLIASNITLTNNINTALGLTLNQPLNGENSNSVFENKGIVSYQHATEPMVLGKIDAFTTPNIFRYSGGQQTMAANSNGTYHQLVITGSGTKSFEGNITANAKLTVENNTILSFGGLNQYKLIANDTLNAQNGVIDMTQGTNNKHLLQLFGLVNIANLAPNAQNQSIVEYLGGANQQVFASANYRNITFSGTAPKILQGNIEASGNTHILNTNVKVNAIDTTFELFITNPTANILRTNGSIIGNLKRNITQTGFPYIFPVGCDTSYHAFTANFINLNNIGSLLVKYKQGNIGDKYNRMPIGDHGVEVWEQFPNGYWHTYASQNLNSNNLEVKLVATGYGIDSASRIFKQHADTLYIEGHHKFVNTDTIARVDLTCQAGSVFNYVIGRGRPWIDIPPIDTTVCFGDSTVFELKARGQGNLTYQWYKTPNIPINGANTNKLVIYNTTFKDTGTYYCVVYDKPGNPKETKPSALLVNLYPQANLLSTRDTICNNTFAFAAIQNSGPDTTYTWIPTFNKNILSGPDTINNNHTLNQKINNNSNNIAIVYYHLRAMGPMPTQCKTYNNDTIIVNPTPTMVAFAPDTVFCNNTTAAINLAPTSTSTSNNYWYKLQISNTNLNNVKAPEYFQIANIAETLANPTNSVQQVTYTFNPVFKQPFTGTQYCENGVPQTITLHYNPTPTLSLNISDNNNMLCNNTEVNFNLATANGNIIGSKYFNFNAAYNNLLISGVANAGLFALTDTAIKQTLTNIPNDSLYSVNYTLKPTFTNYKISKPNEVCEGTETQFKIDVLPTFTMQLEAFKYVGNNNIRCFGESNGQITAIRKGGYFVVDTAIGLNKYNWLYNSQTINNDSTIFINRSAGTYKLEITDFNECKTWDTITLTQPNKLTSVIDADLPKCGSGGGKFTAIAKGGIRPYSYKWVENNIIYSDSLFAPSKAGSYTVNIEDINLCTTQASSVMFSAKPLYNLELRTYQYTNALDSEKNTHITCSGKADAKIELANSINAEGAEVSYKWTKNGVEINNNSVVLNNAGKGKYQLVFTLKYSNNNKCTGTSEEVEIIEPKQLSITPTLNNLTCHYGKNNGKIEINVKGGYNRYAYNWRKLNTNQLYSGKTLTNLDSGLYVITVTDTGYSYQRIAPDSAICQLSDTFELTKPNAINFTQTISNYNNYNISCFNSNTGSIQLSNFTGGIAPYNYKWEYNSQPFNTSGNTLNNLKAGNYKLNISYSDTCSATHNFELTQPNAINLFADSISNYNGYQVSCAQSNNGVIIPYAKGGVPGYNYKWLNVINNATDSAQFNLTVGNNKLQVTDNNNCTFDTIFELKAPNLLTAQVYSTPVSCFGFTNGKAYINATGGLGNYKYKWNTADTTDTIINKPKGNYYVTVTDINNCTVQQQTEISSPKPMNIKLANDTLYHGSHVSCFNAANGKLRATVSGGNFPYYYNWSNGIKGNINTIANLNAGKYSITITDSLKCIGVDSIELINPDMLTISINKRDVQCYNATDAYINTTVTGGTTPYKYVWDNNENTANIKNIDIGSYTLNISDANMCKLDTQINITQPTALVVKMQKNNPYCPESEDGAIKTIVTGGSGYYLYNWDNGQTENDIYNLDEGEFSLTVTDSLNCTVSVTETLKGTVDACLDVPTAFSPNTDGVNDTWNILAGNPNNLQLLNLLYPNCTIQVFDRWGNEVYINKGYATEWNGKSNGRDVPMDSYYYVINLGTGVQNFKGIINVVR